MSLQHWRWTSLTGTLPLVLAPEKNLAPTLVSQAATLTMPMSPGAIVRILPPWVGSYKCPFSRPDRMSYSSTNTTNDLELCIGRQSRCGVPVHLRRASVQYRRREKGQLRVLRIEDSPSSRIILCCSILTGSRMSSSFVQSPEKRMEKKHRLLLPQSSRL